MEKTLREEREEYIVKNIVSKEIEKEIEKGAERELLLKSVEFENQNRAHEDIIAYNGIKEAVREARNRDSVDDQLKRIFSTPADASIQDIINRIPNGHLLISHDNEKSGASVPPMRSNKESNEEGDCSNYISPLDTVDTKYRGTHPLGKLIKYTLFLPVVGLWEFHCRIQNVLGNKPEETVVHFGPDSDSSSSSNGIKSMSMSSSSSSPSDPVKFVKSPNTSDEDTIFSDVMDADELNMNRVKYKVIYDSYCQERAQREAVQANLSPAMQREARNSNLGKELLQRKYADAVIDMIQLENPDSEINYSAEWKGYVMEDLTSYYRKNFKALEDVPSE